MNSRALCTVVQCVHTARGKGPQYELPCQECIEIYSPENRNGCERHINQPKLLRDGSPSYSQLVRNTKKRINGNSTHVVKGAGQLTPSDMRDFLDFASCTGSWYTFGLAVLYLFAIELYLRKEEFTNVKGEDFIPEMFKMKDRFLPENLTLKLKVKRHQGNQHSESLIHAIHFSF